MEKVINRFMEEFLEEKQLLETLSQCRRLRRLRSLGRGGKIGGGGGYSNMDEEGSKTTKKKFLSL